MFIHGTETLEIELAKIGYFFKAIANSHSIVFFPGSIQHREVKLAGLSYEDDYQGNAMACIIKPGSIEIRYHADYSDAEVGRIFRQVLADPAVQGLKGFVVTYQGRSVL